MIKNEFVKTYFRAYNPRNAVAKRKEPIKITSFVKIVMRLGDGSIAYMPILLVLAE